MTSSLTSLRLIRAAASHSERKLCEVLESMNLSHCQATIICSILKGGASSMSALSEVLCCHKSNITQVVDGLEKKGLIERTKCADDHRKCLLTLTPAGTELAKKADAALEIRAKECITVFSEAEQKSLEKILGKFILAMGK